MFFVIGLALYITKIIYFILENIVKKLLEFFDYLSNGYI